MSNPDKINIKSEGTDGEFDKLMQELIDLTDYPNFDIPGSNAAFYEWKKHKAKNIMTFRDNAYRSVMTGTMAPLHHTPWKDALDDSLEAYLAVFTHHYLQARNQLPVAWDDEAHQRLRELAVMP